MALFDASLLFWHQTTSYSFTTGEFVSLATVTANSASGVINLGNARDLGIGSGAEIPTVDIIIGTGFTSSSTTLTVNFQFQGSTDSTHWTTYSETGAQTTASLTAGSQFIFAVPRRPPGAALPLYYQLNALLGSNATASISTGTVLAGIVLEASESAGTLAQYPAGFTVA